MKYLNRKKASWLWFVFFPCAILLSSYSNFAYAQKRLALVIGNSNYQNSPLANPTNDALDMAAMLKKRGFEVDSYSNLDRSGMRRAIRAFGEKLKQTDVGLFYFAGHGIQLKGRNYLIPLKTDVTSADEVQDESIDASSILRKMESAGNSVNIVILDACRNNPFSRSFRSLDQGLARMDGPVGSFIAYATAPGSVAADGAGRNGVYTKYLLKALNQPGLSIEQTFKRVRNAVQQETNKKQIPWESSSLLGEFVFFSNNNNESVSVAIPPEPSITKKYLQIISNVPNAKVIVNNIDRGVVNNKGVLNIENIMEDQVEVIVQAEGYKMESRQMILTPNQWEQLTIELAPIKSPIQRANRQPVSNTCIENKTALLTTKTVFQSENKKKRVIRNIPEFNILLMRALMKYGLKFSNTDLPNHMGQSESNYKEDLSKEINRVNPRYLFRYSSIVNENPINVVNTNMKTISGDLSLEMIDVKSNEILGYAAKTFRQVGINKKAILRKMLKKGVDSLTKGVVSQLCKI